MRSARDCNGQVVCGCFFFVFCRHMIQLAIYIQVDFEEPTDTTTLRGGLTSLISLIFFSRSTIINASVQLILYNNNFVYNPCLFTYRDYRDELVGTYELMALKCIIIYTLYMFYAVYEITQYAYCVGIVKFR